MDIYCTRPGCPRPLNHFADLDNNQTLKTVQQKYCTACGMPLILLGRYIPSKLLGQGGFGAAFLARDRYTPAMRQCVVKQFQPSVELNLEQLALAQTLFEREGEVLEQLGNTHPQIPDLFAFFPLAVPDARTGKPNEFFYLVQEFVDGQNLEQILADQGQLSEAETLEILLEILHVLQFVHDNGSIHRDIKPSNIMRRRDGRYFLLDFGAVKQATKAVAAGGAKGSTGIYSMGYAPPEQMSSGNVYPSTDLYALAVTAINLLTGKPPLDLLDSYNNRWNWRSHAKVSDRLADVLDRMLLPAPGDRFQSAQAVIDALEQPIAISRPSALPQPTPPLQSPPPSRSKPAGVKTAQGQPAPAINPMPPVAPPAPIQPAPPAAKPARPRSTVPAFSILEILAGAAFTGFEGALITIILISLLKPSLISAGLALIMISILAFVQSRRIIEKADLLILAVITTAIIFFFPVLQIGGSLQATLLLAGLAGLVAIAVTALFRLIYNLLSRVV